MSNFMLLLFHVMTKPLGFVLPVALLVISPLYLKDIFSGVALILVCIAYLVFATNFYRSRLVSQGKYDSFIQDLAAKRAK